MNNKVNYKRGNRLEIIKALYATSSMPYKCLRLYTGQLRLNQRLAKKMEREGLLAITKTENGKIIRLNNWESRIHEYREYLPACYVEHYKKQRNELAKCLHDRGRMERLLKNSEVSLLMHLSGIGSYPDEKRMLNDEGVIINPDTVEYYSAREIKNCGMYDKYSDNVTLDNDGKKKVVGSRISGVMVSPGGIYAVYNITNHLIEWERYGELKMATHIEKVMSEKGVANGNEKVTANCLLLADNIEIFERVLTNENNRRRGSTLLNIDYAYECMYAIPSDKNGIAMLQLMAKQEWQLKMESILLAECKKNDNGYSIACDGYNEEDGYVLLFCTGNLAKLKMFLKRATNPRTYEKFCIYCFSFQTPLMKKLGLVGYPSITVKELELEEYLKIEKEIQWTD